MSPKPFEIKKPSRVFSLLLVLSIVCLYASASAYVARADDAATSTTSPDSSADYVPAPTATDAATSTVSSTSTPGGDAPATFTSAPIIRTVSITSFSLPAPIPTGGLDTSIFNKILLHLTLDEGTGTIANDTSGNGLNGTLSGGTTWVPGEVGTSSVSFDGTGDIDVPASPILEPTYVAVSAWVKGGSQGDYKYIAGNGANVCLGSAEYALYTGPNGGLLFYVTGPGGVYGMSPDAGTGVWDNNWHQVVGVYYNSTVSLFVDGIQIGATTTAPSTIDYASYSNNDFHVGAYGESSCGFTFNGSIDDVIVYGTGASGPGTTTPATSTPPTLTLLGSDPLFVAQGDVFADPGATATDATGTDITSSIIVTNGTTASSTGVATDTSLIDTGVLGTTTLTYSVTDMLGLSASTTREVVIIAGSTTGTSTPTTTPTVTPPSTPPGGGGGGSFYGGFSSYASGGSGAALLGTTTAAAPASCPLLTEYLRYGADNDPTEMVKLQSFLKDSQGLDVNVNGAFDESTLAAVNAFQAKYLSDTMGPWGATRTSGYVYITTEKKINEIACDTSLTLTLAEQAIIDAYKASLTSSSASGNGGTNGATGQENGTTTPAASTTSPLIGQNVPNNESQIGAAAVAGTSFFSNLWNLIKGLF